MDWAKPKTRDDDERAAGDRNNTLSCSCLVSLLSKTAGDSLFWTDNSLVLSAAPSGPEGGLRGRHDPVQNEYEADLWAANGSTSGQTGCLRACRGSFRPPGSGHRAAPPVQNDGWQNLFWTRVVLSRSAKTLFPGRGPLCCAPWSFSSWVPMPVLTLSLYSRRILSEKIISSCI